MWFRILGLSVLVWLVACGSSPPEAAIETASAGSVILVTTTADEFNNDRDCSLREALYAANNDVAKSGCPAGKGADTVRLGVAQRYALKNEHVQVEDYDYVHSALPVIRGELTLEGRGSSLNGPLSYGQEKSMTLLFVGHGAKVEISDLSVQGGFNYSGTAGLRNAGQLRASGLNLLANVTVNGEAALSNSGELALSRCRFEDNVSTGGTAGLHNYDLRVTPRRYVANLDECIFRNNTTGVPREGAYSVVGVAAINNLNGRINVRRSAIIENRAVSYVRSTSRQWPAIVKNDGAMSFQNTTLSQNEGSVFNVIENSKTLELDFATLYDNESTINARAVHAIYTGRDAETRLSNSILALNKRRQAGSLNHGYGNCGGFGLTSKGYNYDDDGSCKLTANGDITGTPGQRHSLVQVGDNGGFTPSHAFNPFLKKPLFQDLGNPVYDTRIRTDQRGQGYVREKSSRVDQGAIEGCTSYGIFWLIILPIPYCNEGESVAMELRILDAEALSAYVKAEPELFEMAQRPCEQCLNFIRLERSSLMNLVLSETEARVEGMRLYKANGELIGEFEGSSLELKLEQGDYFLEFVADVKGEASVSAEFRLEPLD